MTDKQVVIELEELPHANKKYKITRLVNSVDFNIGEILTKSLVQGLILEPNVKTVVKPNRKQKR